ncbi:hypothetical protein ACVWYG_002551 [Pedobacter sp. UYEF25]
MSDNEKLFEVFEYLKGEGLIKTLVELSGVLNTNKAGINDLKTGHKKISIENIRDMKNSYPQINLDWWLIDRGDMILPDRNLPMAAEPAPQYDTVSDRQIINSLHKVISAQDKTINALETVIASQTGKKDVLTSSAGVL